MGRKVPFPTERNEKSPLLRPLYEETEMEELQLTTNTETKEGLLRKVRGKRLKEVLKHYMREEYDQAILKAKGLYELAKELFEMAEKDDVYELLGDGFLKAKCLLKGEDITGARGTLLELWMIAQEYVSDEKIEYKKDSHNLSKLARIQLRKESANFVERETLSNEEKKELNEQVQKISNLFSTFATLFYTVGDFKNCEEAYVKYVKLIENNFGPISLEASNCYFLTGAFYLEHKYYIKSMACFKKALKIRQEKFGGEMFEAVADCYYNMAVIYKQTGEIDKAMKSLNTAFKIREALIGELSLPVAQVLELMGKIFIEQEDYKMGLSKLYICFIIRKKVLRNENHQDIVRIKLLLQDLLQIIHNKLYNEKIPLNKKEALLQLQREIDAKNLQQDIKVTVPEPIKSKEQISLSKPTLQTDRNIEEDELKGSITKTRTSFRGQQEVSEVPRGLENELVRNKSETSIEKNNSSRPSQATLKPTVPSLRPLSLEKLHKNSRSDRRETEPKEGTETEVYSIQYKDSLEHCSINKGMTSGGSIERENSRKSFVRPDFTRLTTQPQIAGSLISPDGKKKLVKAKTTFFNIPRSPDIKGIQKTLQTIESKAKARKLYLPEEFLETLAKHQMFMLNELHSAIREKSQETIETLILESEFFKSLGPVQRGNFVTLNEDLDLIQDG